MTSFRDLFISQLHSQDRQTYEAREVAVRGWHSAAGQERVAVLGKWEVLSSSPSVQTRKRLIPWRNQKESAPPMLKLLEIR
jgi:hypothetical protein